jgi:L-serine deaminase
MQECVQNGICHEGILPGGLNAKCCAASLCKHLKFKWKVDFITPWSGAMGKVIITMGKTGKDMLEKFKEISEEDSRSASLNVNR